MVNVSMEINEVFDYTKEINVYNDGNKTSYCVGDKPFEEIMVSWNALLEGSHPMPALGVSINKETVREMQKGLWVEFGFDEVLEANGLPFEKLLVNVSQDYYGFNLIRYNTRGGYDGRCLYIDLVGRNMTNFYNVVINI